MNKTKDKALYKYFYLLFFTTVTVSLLEIAVKDRIARQSDKQYKLQNQTTRFLKNSWKLYCTRMNKVKFSHTSYWAFGSELIPVYRQSACRWLSHLSGGRLPLLSARPAVTSIAFTRWRHPYTVAHVRFQLTTHLSTRKWWKADLAWVNVVKCKSKFIKRINARQSPTDLLLSSATVWNCLQCNKNTWR